MAPWNPKYFIVYPYEMISELEKPEGWGYLCGGNLSEALKEVLNVKSIGSEIKLIWNNQHYWQLIKDYQIEPQELDDYVKSNCSLLSFKSEFLMKRVVKQLKKMGAKKDFICLNNYRDVILQQAHYKNFGTFNNLKSYTNESL